MATWESLNDSAPRLKKAQKRASHFLDVPSIETAEGLVTPMEWLLPAYNHPENQSVTGGGNYKVEELILDPGSDPSNPEGRYGFTALRHEANARLFARIKKNLAAALRCAPELQENLPLKEALAAFPPDKPIKHGSLALGDLDKETLSTAIEHLSNALAFHPFNEPEFLDEDTRPASARKAYDAVELIKDALVMHDYLSFNGPTRHLETYGHGGRNDVENIDASATYELAAALRSIAKTGRHDKDSAEALRLAVSRLQDIKEVLDGDISGPALNPKLEKTLDTVMNLQQQLGQLTNVALPFAEPDRRLA